MANVAELVSTLHSNIDSIHKCISSLSDTSSHDAEMERLEKEREEQILALKQKHEAEAAELEAQRKAEEEALLTQRKAEEEDLAAQRKKEEEEIAERRRKEDEERRLKLEAEEEERMKKIKEEDEVRQKEAEEKSRMVQEQVEKELERLEDEMERKVEEGKKMLLELDEKRKSINAQIDAALNTPTVFPKIHFRSRAKTGLSREVNGIDSVSSPAVVGETKEVDADPTLTNGHSDAVDLSSDPKVESEPAVADTSENEIPAVSVATPESEEQHAEADPAASDTKASESQDSSLNGLPHKNKEQAEEPIKEVEEPTISSPTPDTEHDGAAESLSIPADKAPAGDAIDSKYLENNDAELGRVAIPEEGLAAPSREAQNTKTITDGDGPAHELVERVVENVEAETGSGIVPPPVAEKTAGPEAPELASHETLEAADTPVRNEEPETIDLDEPSILDLNAPPPEVGSTHMEASDPTETRESASIQDESTTELIPEFASPSKDLEAEAEETQEEPAGTHEIAENHEETKPHAEETSEEASKCEEIHDTLLTGHGALENEASASREQDAVPLTEEELRKDTTPHEAEEHLDDKEAPKEAKSLNSVVSEEAPRAQETLDELINAQNAHYPAPINKDTPTSTGLLGQEQNLHPVDEKKLAPQSDFQPVEGQEDNSVTDDILQSLESPETEHKTVVTNDATENDQNSLVEKPPHEEASVVEEGPMREIQETTSHEEAVVDNEAASNAAKVSLESPELVEDGEVHTPEHYDASFAAAEMEELEDTASHHNPASDNQQEVEASSQPDIHDIPSHTEHDKRSDETPSNAEIEGSEVLEGGSHAESAASELQKQVSHDEVGVREGSSKMGPETPQTDAESTDTVNGDEDIGVKNKDSHQFKDDLSHVEEEQTLHSAETLDTVEVGEATSHEDAPHSNSAVHTLPDVASHEEETGIAKETPDILPKASKPEDLPVREVDADPQETEMTKEHVEPSQRGVSLANGSDTTPMEKSDTESMLKEDPEDIDAQEEIVRLNSAQSAVKLEHKEDPEDVKAREEIARLNAELMKAAMEEEEKGNAVSRDDVQTEIPAPSSEVVAKPSGEEKEAEPEVLIDQEGSAPMDSQPNHQNVEDANPGHISPGYELSDSFIPPIESHQAQDVNTEHFIEIPERPSTPIHHDIPHGFAESPVTVLNADDLFADDDEDDDQVLNGTGHRVEAPNASDTQRPAMPGSFLSENTQHGSETRETKVSTTPETQYQEEEHQDHYLPHRRSGMFASLVDALRHDVPLVSQLISQEYNSVPDEDSYDEPVRTNASHHDQAKNGTLSSTRQETSQQESDEEFPLRPVGNDDGLHIRTHTADTVPSFESYAQSDEDDSPTTPSDTVSSPFMENPHEEPNIRSSWSPPRDNLNAHVTDQEMKPQASPLQAEFDPYNTQTYPNYVTPKASFANLRAQDSPEYPNDSVLAEPALPPPRRSTPKLDTSHAQSFPNTYDSPISTTHSHPSSPQTSPTRTSSHLQRRPTLTSRPPSSLSRTPANSPLVPTSTSFFQKTRSLFESQAQSPSPPPPRVRPRSGVFTVSAPRSSTSASGSGSPGRSRTGSVSSPTPPVKSRSRPSSLYGQSPRHEDNFVPKSLDGNGKPPSPAFVPTPPARSPKRNSLHYPPSDSNSKRNTIAFTRENGNGSPFSDNLSRLAGLGTGTQVSGGLEDSIHNPGRFSNKRGREGDEIGGGERDRLLDNGY